jgi:hypothetical protein
MPQPQADDAQFTNLRPLFNFAGIAPYPSHEALSGTLAFSSLSLVPNSRPAFIAGRFLYGLAPLTALRKIGPKQ